MAGLIKKLFLLLVFAHANLKIILSNLLQIISFEPPFLWTPMLKVEQHVKRELKVMATRQKSCGQ